MNDEEKTPLEVICENAMFLKQQVINTVVVLSDTVKDFDSKISMADEAINPEMEESVVADILRIKERLMEQKAKYISETWVCLADLKGIIHKVNEQLHRQVPMEKRVTLLIDFDLLVEDCARSEE